ncbi:hypothetical protein EV359DRAFT_69233, partial [Lentinula novae-zelandiae]
MSLLNPSDNETNGRPLDEHQNNDVDDTHREGRRRLEKEREEINLRHKNDPRPPAEPTIDDLESRVRRPLPSRRLMPEPQPSDHIHSPTHEDEYPYGKLTRTQYETLEQRPMGFGINFSNQTFPRPFVPTPLLLKNMKDYQRQQATTDANNVLALVPFGAGPRWEEKYSMRALVAIRDWLLQVDFPDKGKCQVSKAEAQSNKDRRDFGNPWTIILYDISANFRAWLLDLGVVALSEPGATFMVHSFDEGKMSWVLLNFCGPAVEDKEEERLEAL